MTLLHGWINTRSQSKELLSVYDWLNKHNGFHICSHGMNGEVVWNLFSCRNGYSPSVDILFEKLHEAISHESPDTYGLIYILNDEDSETFDTWQVWIICHNSIIVSNDTFLSPYSSKVAWIPPDEI